MHDRLMLLEDKWSPRSGLDEIDALVYRSNLLGSDLRITNYAGGNTSAKVELPDPLTGESTQVLVVKGSGGDLGSIRRSGFAQLYLNKLESLKRLYGGPHAEDDMPALYAICAFGSPGAPASIDTPLHAFLPFRHVDHLHPDWAIALAAASNGEAKMAEFNRRFGRRLLWLPWLRPGFELGLQMGRAVAAHPDCDGIVLANHGLFTWGDTSEESYRSSIRTIDQLGAFVSEHEASVTPFGGQRAVTRRDPVQLIRELRDAMQTAFIAHFDGSAEALEFVNSRHAAELAARGTSCPDHFIRTRVAPLYLEDGSVELALDEYRSRYRAYYDRNVETDSPPIRSLDPAVVLVPGAGMFTFARTKAEARITAEFYRNAIRVMRGATALDGGAVSNYVALPEREAFRIEYWSLEEAKLRRMPAEGVLARRIAWAPYADDGVTSWLAKLGAQVSHDSVAETVLAFGGIDFAVNAPEPMLAEARPEWVIRASSLDDLEVRRYAEILPGA